MIHLTTSYRNSFVPVGRLFIRTVNTKVGQLDSPPRASPEQLTTIANVASQHMKIFFKSSIPYERFLTRDVVFLNNINSIRTRGLSRYILYMFIFRVYYSIRYSPPNIEVLSLVKIPEESCIRIRWRIKCYPGYRRVFTAAWTLRYPRRWLDGISTLHVNKDGLVYCHVCDNIDVDLDEAKMEKTIKKTLVNRGIDV